MRIMDFSSYWCSSYRLSGVIIPAHTDLPLYNLPHSLVVALLFLKVLNRLTWLSIPTLILSANLTDIDAGCALYGIESLAMRRGLTHGPIALLVLPLLLWAAMLAFDRWQEIGRASCRERVCQ